MTQGEFQQTDYGPKTNLSVMRYQGEIAREAGENTTKIMVESKKAINCIRRAATTLGMKTLTS
jgi:hypothetical protein